MNAKELAEDKGDAGATHSAFNPDSERLQLLTWRKIWRDLSGNNGLSWQAMFVFVPVGCIAAAVYDHNRLGGSDAGWSMTTIAGYVVALVAMLLLKAYSRVNRYRRSLTMFAGFILVGIARGLTIYQVGLSFELIPSSEIAFRILGSSFLVVWLLAGGSVVVVAAAEYREATTKLKTELAYLAGSKTALGRSLATITAQLHTRINNVLVPATKNLVEKLSAASLQSAENAVNGLQEMIEKVVRPLSHRVARPNFLGESEAESVRVRTNTVGEVLRGNVALGDVVLPAFVATATVLTALPSTIIALDLRITVAVVAMGWLSVYAFLFLTRAVLKDLFVPIWFASILSFVFPLLAGSGVIIGKWGLLVGIPEPAGYEFFTLAACLSFAAFWFQVLELKRAQSLRQLANVAEQQRQLVSAMRREIWVLQRHLASTLHGPVQAALFSSLVKFGQRQIVEDDEVAELLTNLQSAIELLKNEPGVDRREFNEVWNELRDFWSGVCDIEAEFDETLIDELSDNGQALRCALEVIREAINNAVKHAEASKASVRMFTEDNLLHVEVCNNGKPIDASRTEGFGSELIREVTHSYELIALPQNPNNWATQLRASIVLTQLATHAE